MQLCAKLACDSAREKSAKFWAMGPTTMEYCVLVWRWSHNNHVNVLALKTITFQAVLFLKLSYCLVAADINVGASSMSYCSCKTVNNTADELTANLLLHQLHSAMSSAPQLAHDDHSHTGLCLSDQIKSDQ
jgi:hypothetical protein